MSNSHQRIVGESLRRVKTCSRTWRHVIAMLSRVPDGMSELTLVSRCPHMLRRRPSTAIIFSIVSHLPAFIESAGNRSPDTIEKIIAVDGLLRNICGHLRYKRQTRTFRRGRETTWLWTCLQVLEQVFTLLKDSRRSAGAKSTSNRSSMLSTASYSPRIAGDPSIHACCRWVIMINASFSICAREMCKDTVKRSNYSYS